ncbi:MAG: TorF family putative porin [Burkholderiales bacterium]|nr:TorF family putative porin [Burkholderiales bacterium]
MLKKSIIAGLVASAFAPAFATAADSQHELTGNVGVYSQYIFRGLTQTDRKPALQGGFDYSHSSGFYAGTWMSNVSWLRDFGAYSDGASLEMDFYGGFKGSIGKSDFGYDIGILQYYYPGTVVAGGTKADTLELYGALSWKWLSAKYSHSIGNKTFGVTDSRGTWYLDLTASIPVTDKLTATLHYGKQKFEGGGGAASACGAGISNNTCASYEDYKIGLSYALPKDFTLGAYYTDTRMNATREAFYTTPNNRFVGKDAFTVYLSKTF